MAEEMGDREQPDYIDTWCMRLHTATKRKDLSTIREMVDSLQSLDDERYPLRSTLKGQPWRAWEIVGTLLLVGEVDSQTIAQFLVHADCPITCVDVRYDNIVELTIQLGSSANYVFDNYIIPALHQTIWRGSSHAPSRLRLIELLLNNGADCHYIDEEGMSPLHRCLRGDDTYEVLQLLVSRGVLSNSSALLTALLRNQPREVIQLLMQVDIDIRFRDDRGFAEIYNSTCRYNEGQDAVEYLLDLGMDPKTLDLDGKNILYFAFAKVSLEYLRCLVLVYDVDLNDTITHYGPMNILTTVYQLSEIIDVEKNQQEYEDVAKKIRFCLLRGVNINNGWGDSPMALQIYSQKDKWIDLRLEQTAISEFMDLPVDKSIANVFYADKNYASYIAACKYELVALMDTQFYNHITLFNILTDGDPKMMNYVGNEELLTAFHKFGEKHLFPIYWPALIERVEQFLYLYGIRKKAIEMLGPLLPSVISYEIVQEIAKHLSIMDLFKLSKFHRE